MKNRIFITAFGALLISLLAMFAYEAFAACAAPTATLSASPTSILPGGSSTLTWTSTQATSCTGTNFSTGGATSGSVSASPTMTTIYTLTCNTGATATASVTVGVPNLTVSSNNRYFQDPNGNPVYLVGDDAAGLIMSLTAAQQSTYFSTRHSQGFNAAWIDANWQFSNTSNVGPCNSGNIGPKDALAACNSPFDGTVSGTFDVSTPDTAYWAGVDAMIRLAAQNGIYVILDIYDSYSPWFTHGVSPNSTAALTSYGNFIGNRYGSSAWDNVIYMVGNDFNPGNTTSSMITVMQGLRAKDTRHLGIMIDYQTSDNLGGSRDTNDSTLAGLLAPIDSIYEYRSGPWRAHYLNQYNKTPVMPIFNMEAGYELNTDSSMLGGGMTNEDKFRNQHWVFLLNGAAGDITGNNFVWQFFSSPSWNSTSGLTSVGATQITYFVNFIKAIPWQTLIPDQNATVFTGLGTPTDYSGAYASNNLAVAWQPSSGAGGNSGAQNITVKMSYFSGTVTAKWFDPTNGTYSTIGTGLANSGSRTFTSAATNSAGANDWVLLLTSP